MEEQEIKFWVQLEDSGKSAYITCIKKTLISEVKKLSIDSGFMDGLELATIKLTFNGS